MEYVSSVAGMMCSPTLEKSAVPPPPAANEADVNIPPPMEAVNIEICPLELMYWNEPESILIVGAGGLGLMGVQLASHMAKCNIICADLDNEKLNTAKELGATHTVNTKESDASEKIMSICNSKGVDSIVDFVNAPPTVKLDLSVVRKRGNIILVGLFGGSVELPLVSVPLKAITIQGAYTGNYNDMIELIELAKQGVINPIVSKHYTLDEATHALNDLKNRKILGRAVINP